MSDSLEIVDSLFAIHMVSVFKQVNLKPLNLEIDCGKQLDQDYHSNQSDQGHSVCFHDKI